MSQNPLIDSISTWLLGQALGNPDIVEMFEIVCKRLHAAGVPIRRGRLIWPTLHPLFQAENVSWNLGDPAELGQFEHQDNDTKAWKASPLSHVVENQIEIFRRRLTGPNETLDFEMLEELKEEGYTDYLVMATQLYEQAASGTGKVLGGRGILVTWSTDRRSGFSQDDLMALQQIQRVLAVACKTVIQTRISRNVTSTYLGARAGERVYSGQIRRGDGQDTNAVVWYSDMRDSTSFAETLPAEDYFSMLNSYFESTASSVVDHGGEVLDFIGDAVLGIFPYDCEESLKEAAANANQALDQTLERVKEVNAERAAAGAERFHYGVGLDVGKVMFGNIGIPERLSFSIIGPTVNQVARIEGMTKLLQQTVLAGRTLAELNPERWKSVGKHKLEGVMDPQELFAFNGASKAA